MYIIYYPVGLDNIYKTVKHLNVMQNINVQIIIVYLGHMYVMENGTVLMVMMKILITAVQQIYASINLNAETQKYASIFWISVTMKMIASREMMNSCAHSKVLNVSSIVIAWDSQ